MDPRVDTYIANAPEYARPILKRIRGIFHEAFPAIVENIKWGNPTFEQNGIVGGMGAFKEHVAYGFWNAPAMRDPEGLFADDPKKSPYGLKASKLGDLPAKRVLIAYVKEAVELDAAGVKAKKGASKPPPKAPGDLIAALKRNRKARATYDQFPPSKKRDYVEWVTEAKREATRAKRIAQAVEWMAEGKPRNWKYEKR